MPYYEFIWDDGPGGNVDHLAEHGVTVREAEHVVKNPEDREQNRSHPGRMFAIGYTTGNRYLGVSYEHLDATTVYVVTAFDME